MLPAQLIERVNAAVKVSLDVASGVSGQPGSVDLMVL
jgi:NAD(P)H-hydrate repair Nnr-like enzyme with NAD(P)H-hydrate epimerase domain